MGHIAQFRVLKHSDAPESGKKRPPSTGKLHTGTDLKG